jgi:hypothetical protein
MRILKKRGEQKNLGFSFKNEAIKSQDQEPYT